MQQYTRFFIIFLLYAMSGNVFADIRKNTGTIDPDYINLSAQEFLSFYARGTSQEKENVLMYVLGVSDATESKTWCGYNKINEIELYSSVLTYLNQQSVNDMNMRASTLIEQAMIRLFPCPDVASQEKKSPRQSSVSHLTSGAFDLNGDDFFRFWQSDNRQDRLNAKIYLLGIEDATESKTWCDYKTIKTVTLDEIIYWYFRKKTSDKLNERAANIIIEALSKNSCDKGNNK